MLRTILACPAHRCRRTDHALTSRRYDEAPQLPRLSGFEELALKGIESVRRRVKAEATPVTNDDAGFHRDAERLRVDFNDVIIGHEKLLPPVSTGALFEVWEDEGWRAISHVSTDMRQSLPMRSGRRIGLGRRSNLENETSSYLSIAEEPTKTLRGALALVTRRKLLHQIRGQNSKA
jgi:hypothetical protein